LIETKGTVLDVTTTGAHLMDTVWGQLGHGGGATQKKLTLLASLGTLATGGTMLVF